VRLAGPLRLRAGGILRARLGGDGPLGNGADPSTTDVCALQYERSLPAVPHAADRDLQSHLHRQILLHSLLPAGRPSGKGVGSRPPALSAQYAVVSFG